MIALAAIALAAVLTLTAVALRPSLGAYLFLLANPLIVGIGRGDLVPILRPNELLLLLILAAFALRVFLLMLSRAYVPPPLDRVDTALLAMALAGSVLPLALRYVRALPVTADDVLYSIVLLKYCALYRLFRDLVLTPRQVERCLYLSMISAAIVAVVAIMQVNRLFGVPELLHAYYDRPFEGHTGPVTGRGTSTLASSFGVADVMVMNLVVALALLATKRQSRWILLLGALLFQSGCVVAGAFSGYIALVVVLLAFGVVTGRLIRIVPLSAVGIVTAAVLFWPVIEGRLMGFRSPEGVPHSWSGRWENLQTFFFPELFSGVNWILGVRPAPRLPAPETWRDWIYIESGYVWLLWIGGLPFLAAFILFAAISFHHLGRAARERSDAIGAAATASLCYLVGIVVLMLFDPHLTVRGSADLFFPLLALGLAGRHRIAAPCRHPGALFLPTTPANRWSGTTRSRSGGTEAYGYATS